MKRLFAFLLCFTALATVQASEEVHFDHVDIDLHDQASLQHGAKIYVNYCLGCHSLGFIRYSQLAEGIGLSEEQVKQNLMFVGEKFGDPLKIATPKDKSEQWFGQTPPDLSLVARYWGPDKLYAYLRSFYVDPARPMGVNNMVFKDVGMPHVLMELQGKQKPIFKDVKEMETGEDGSQKEVTKQVFDHFELTPGQLSSDQYDATVRDLVNFLTFVGEPHQLDRQALGYKVILFLLVLFVLAYLLKKEFWKDIH